MATENNGVVFDLNTGALIAVLPTWSDAEIVAEGIRAGWMGGRQYTYIRDGKNLGGWKDRDLRGATKIGSFKSEPLTDAGWRDALTRLRSEQFADAWFEASVNTTDRPSTTAAFRATYGA